MRRVLGRLFSTAREFGSGIDAGHAVRHGAPVRGRALPAGPREPVEPPGGPFLHWVPDRAGGFRLAGDYVPEQRARRAR